MNKLITKIVGVALGLTMTVGVGVGFAVGSNREAVPVHAATSANWVQHTGTVTAGEYLIVSVAGTVCMAPTGAAVANGGYSQVAFTASSAPENGFTLVASDSAFKITDQTSATTYYVYASGTTNNGLRNGTSSEQAGSTWTITETATSGEYTIISETSRQISLYSTSNWRSYGNTSGSKTNVKLYEKYTPAETYTVSFNNNGGTGTMSDVTGIYGSYELPSCTFTAPSGYAFAGWKANNAGSLLAVGDSYTVNAAVTFYAQWASQRTMTYDSNGGSGTMTDTNSPYGDGATVTVLANAFTAPEGKRFAHWNTEDDDTGTSYGAGDTFTIGANTTLYAIWEDKPNEVVVTMDDATGLGNSYGEGSWSVDGVTGKVFAIKNTTQFQFSKNSGVSYFYNIDAIPGPITKISLNKSSGTSRTIEMFLGTSEINTKPDSGGISNNTDYVWDVDPDDELTYFYFWNNDTGAAYFDTITITYQKVSLVDPTGITLDNSSSISMDTYGYGNRQLSATVEPYNANDKTVTWGTNNPAIVTISDGVLTPIGVGSTTVYACTANYNPEDPNPDLIKTVSVTVTQAEYKKATFVPTSISAATQADDYLSSGSVTVSYDTAVGEYNTAKHAIQLAGGKDSVFTISGYDGMKITGVDLVMSSNATAGTGSLTVTIGSTNVLEIETAPFSDSSWNGAFDANGCNLYKDSTDYVVGTGEDIVFSFGATVNSLYIHSVSIRYLDYSLEQWCQDFLDNYTCDSTGASAPSTSDWDDFGLEFLGLDSDLQLIAKNATADEEGTVIEQAMAKYDYVISKYGALEDEHGAKLYDNFIERTVQPLHSTRVNGTINSTTATIIIAVISTISLTAVGGYFFLIKKKEQ